MRLTDRALDEGKRLLPERLKRRIKAALGVPDMEASLGNMKDNGFHPRIVIDVGAYAGEWARMCHRLFPNARVLMIEPQRRLGETLKNMAAQDVRLQFSPSLVGAAVQASVAFYESDTASSILPGADRVQPPPVFLPMTTLDEITRNTPFAQPDFIKLDVQGAELAVLTGARGALASAEAVLMEVNLLEIYSSVPLFHQAVAYMAEGGFRVYDICAFTRRPLDNALWQADVIFVKPSSILVSSRNWGNRQ